MIYEVDAGKRLEGAARSAGEEEEEEEEVEGSRYERRGAIVWGHRMGVKRVSELRKPRGNQVR